MLESGSCSGIALERRKVPEGLIEQLTEAEGKSWRGRNSCLLRLGRLGFVSRAQSRSGVVLLFRWHR